MTKPKLTKEKNAAGDLIYKLNYNNIGYLEFQIEDNIIFLIYVEVDPEYRNEGIATYLLEYFFKLISKKEYILDISQYLDDGEKYLKNIIQNLINKYNIQSI